MLKKKNFLNNKNKISPAKKHFSKSVTKTTLLNPVYTNKTTNERDEQSQYFAIYETKKKPKPKISEHKHVFG
jgi:hypothetical protein